ncbi:Imm48 family immunity protein [Photobacterium nomapromontoriensis]|uniref:Imm48 family immunity protein n=1 Tax=Photobacterium nomapromontoriensis TaxID=2910237 RepID=UPI003D0C4827
MSDLSGNREQNANMINSIFSVIDIKLEETSELQRQLLATFAFGMVYADGKIKGLSPVEVHGLVISMLQSVFNYSADQSGEFSSLLIKSASDKSVHSIIHAVIHRGIKGHYQWKKKHCYLLKENIEEIFDEVK